MPRYVAFLRGVSPMNAKMSELKKCFEFAGFTEVKTVLAGGNIIFNSRTSPPERLQKKIEAAMKENLDRSFSTIVRPVEELQKLLDSDPHAGFKLPKQAKKVITFLRDAKIKKDLKLPIERDGVFILSIAGAEVFTAYLPHEKGPVFMQMLEKTFGKEITTRTVGTVKKCIAA